MTKSETLAKITSMEAEPAALKKKLEEKEWVNPVKPTFQIIGTNWLLKLNPSLFADRKAAEDWAFVFKTMLEIAACDGVEPVKKGKAQWFIDIDCASLEIEPRQWTPTGLKFLSISPPFSTREQAQAALDKIGAENIMRMIKIRSFMEV